MTRISLRLFGAAFLTLLLSLVAFGQTDRGTITGTVTDNTGAVVPGATVTATNLATNAVTAAVTTSDGVYSVLALQAGNYKVRIEKQGFKAAEIASVTVVVGNSSSANFSLE